MIDPSNEVLIPFPEAPQHIPGGPHISTLHRWRMKGVRGRRLETLIRGGRRFTSLEAIGRFMQSDDPAETPDFNERSLQRRAEQAGRALENRGL